MNVLKTKTVAITLQEPLINELDRIRKRQHLTRSELLREALRRYITVAERSDTIPVENALPKEIEAMRRANEEHARGECIRLEDLQRELGLRTR
jgi:metal-responsive CopG/Arc/MetJ family transcriptional regulator